MKIRNGFVSNSSSSSYLVFFKKENLADIREGYWDDVTFYDSYNGELCHSDVDNRVTVFRDERSYIEQCPYIGMHFDGLLDYEKDHPEDIENCPNNGMQEGINHIITYHNYAARNMMPGYFVIDMYSDHGVSSAFGNCVIVGGHH